MSEGAPDTGFDGFDPGGEVDVWAPAGEVAIDDVVDAELVDEDEAPAEELPEVDGEAIDTPTDVEPWAVSDDPGSWGFGAPPANEPRQSPHDGARPGGGPTGSRGGGSGAGGGGFTGKMSRAERKRRQREAGGGGGDKVLFKIEKRVYRTTNASLIDGRGAGSNNRAGVVESRSSRGNGGRSSRGSKGSGGGSGGFGPKGTTIASKGWRW